MSKKDDIIGLFLGIPDGIPDCQIYSKKISYRN